MNLHLKRCVFSLELIAAVPFFQESGIHNPSREYLIKVFERLMHGKVVDYAFDPEYPGYDVVAESEDFPEHEEGTSLLVSEYN